MTARRAARAKGWREDRYRQLVERLVVERKRLGLTQTDLAGRLERQQPFISRFETGERRLDVAEFAEFAEFAEVAVALGLNPGQIISELWDGQ